MEKFFLPDSFYVFPENAFLTMKILAGFLTQIGEIT